jgi:phosphate acetyltransferase
VSKSLYIAAASARAGKGLAALGVMDVIARKVGRIGLFRPITPGYEERDALIEMLIAQYNLDIEYEDVCPFQYNDMAESLSQGNTEKVISQVVDAYNHIKSKYDFTLIIGSDYLGPTAASELELNAMFATNMGSPVLLVVSGNDLSPEEVATSAGHARHVLSENSCSLVATIINRVAAENRDSVLTAMAKHEEIQEPVYVLREVPVLSALTIDEIAAGLGGEIVSGEGPDLQREVDKYVAGSGHVPMVLDLLDAGVLLVAAGDRDDLAVAAAAVASSPELPSPAGLVLTCGVIPSAVTMRLLESSHLPVIAVKEDTYQTLHKLDQIPGQIRTGSRRKIAAALAEFSAGVAIDELEKHIQLSETVVITPLMFTVNILEKARSEKKHIVLPEGNDERILRAADELLHGGIVDLTILGKVEEIQALARHLGLDISAAKLVDPVESPLRKEFADEYAKLRAHKGIGWQDAFDRMSDPSYFGTMLVYKDYADGMVSGATHTTAETIRPALEVIKTVPGVSLVSSTFLMCMPDKVLAFADCAVNPDPNAAQLAEIAQSTAETAQAFGITPRIAMLSYSTGDSGTGAEVEKVRKATEILTAARPDLPIAGPIQYDAAVDAGVAEAKMPGNPVAGKATVLIFPDLNSGNTAYKAVQRSANAIAVGPVLQGLKKPVNDLSRGCTIPDIVSTVAITAIQAQTNAKGVQK